MKEIIIALLSLNIGCGTGFLLGRIGIPKIKSELEELFKKIDQKVEDLKEKVDEIRS